MKAAPKNYVEERPKIGLSKEFMIDMARMIRGQFCPEWDDQHWNMHLWIVQRTITYPAKWLNKRSIFVPPARYREILLELLQEVKRKGGAIKFPPGYLLHCVQEHMRFSADRYNAEGKAARDQLGRVLAGLRTGEARPDEFVKTMAAGYDLIRKPTRRRTAPEPAAQGSLGL